VTYADPYKQRLMEHRQKVGSRLKPHIAYYDKDKWACWNFGPGTGAGRTAAEAYHSWFISRSPAWSSPLARAVGGLLVPSE
jgi:hypothetical protein